MAVLKKLFHFSAERSLKMAGDLFIYHSDYAGALSYVENALDDDPQDPRAWGLYGDILYCLNRDETALAAFETALALNPHLPEAHISRAGVLESLGRYRDALQSCTMAFTCLQPYQNYLLPSLYDQQLSLLIHLRRYRQAQVLLAQAVTQVPEPEADYLLASYRGIIDQHCRKRATQPKAHRPALHILPPLSAQTSPH